MKYVGNFLSVYRVRPRDLDEDARSDEDFDDEKLVLDENLLERAMKSRVGGKERENIERVKDTIDGKSSHEENSRSAMELATKIWPEKEVQQCLESSSQEYDAENLKQILAAAKASQKKS